MTRKAMFITLGAISATAIFAAGVAVPIALRKHQSTYVVTLDRANGAHYILLQMDTKSNKAGLIKDIKIWDVNSADSNAVAAVASYTKISEAAVAASIKGGKDYSSGLEKLLFDLMQLKDNKDEVTIVFPNITVMENGKKVSKEQKIIFKKDFVIPAGDEKAKAQKRYNMLKTGGTYHDQFVALVKHVLLYRTPAKGNKSDKANIKLTTDADYNSALDKMYGIISK